MHPSDANPPSEAAESISKKTILRELRSALPDGWKLGTQRNKSRNGEILFEDEARYIISSRGTTRFTMTLEGIQGDWADAVSFDIFEEISGEIIPGRGMEDLVRLSAEETRLAINNIIHFLETVSPKEESEENGNLAPNAVTAKLTIPEDQQILHINAYTTYLRQFPHITVELGKPTWAAALKFQSMRVFSKANDLGLDIVFYDSYAEKSTFIPHTSLGAVVRYNESHIFPTEITIPGMGGRSLDTDIYEKSSGKEVLYTMGSSGIKKMLEYFIKDLSCERRFDATSYGTLQDLLPVKAVEEIREDVSIEAKLSEDDLEALFKMERKRLLPATVSPAHLMEQLFDVPLLPDEVLQDLSLQKISVQDLAFHPALSGQSYAIFLFQEFLELLAHEDFFSWHAGEQLDPTTEQEIDARVDKLRRQLQNFHSLRNAAANVDQLSFAGMPLRFLQKKAVLGTRDWFSTRNPENAMLTRLILPPGLGKTGVATLLSYILTSNKTLYLTSNIGNAQQVIQAYEQHAATLTPQDRKKVAACFNGKFDATADVLVGMFPKLMAKSSQALLQDVDLVFIDEADLIALSAKRSPYLRKFSELGIPVIALSATQMLENGKHLKDLFPEAIIEIETPTGLKECIDRKEAAPIRISDLVIDAALHVTVEEKRSGAVALRPKHVDMQWFLSDVLDHYEKEFRTEGGVLLPAGIAVQRNDDARMCVEEALKRGIRAALYTHETPADERTVLREQMNNGEIDLLVGSDMIGRGMDIPALTVMYNAKMTQSPQEFWQTMLRPGRINPAKPDKFAYAINVVPKAFYNVETNQKLAWASRPLSAQMFFGASVLPVHNATATEHLKPQGRQRMQETGFDVQLAHIVRSNEDVVAQLKMAAKPFDIFNQEHLRMFFGSLIDFLDCFSLPVHEERYEYNDALNWSFQYKNFFAMLDQRYTGDFSLQIRRLALDLYGKEYLEHYSVREITVEQLRNQQETIDGFWRLYFSFADLKACIKNGRVTAAIPPHILHHNARSFLTPATIAAFYATPENHAVAIRRVIEDAYPELLTQYEFDISNKDTLAQVTALPHMQKFYQNRDFDTVVLTDTGKNWNMSIRDMLASMSYFVSKGSIPTDDECSRFMRGIWPDIEKKIPLEYNPKFLLVYLRTPLYFIRRGILIDLASESIEIGAVQIPLLKIAEFFATPLQETKNEKLIEILVQSVWGAEGVAALKKQIVRQKDKEAIIEGIGNWDVFLDDRGSMKKISTINKIPFTWHGTKYHISGKELWQMVFGKPYDTQVKSTRLAPYRLFKALLGEERASIFLQRCFDPTDGDHVRKLIGDPWRFIQIEECSISGKPAKTFSVPQLRNITLEYAQPEEGRQWKWNAYTLFMHLLDYPYPKQDRHSARNIYLLILHRYFPEVCKELQSKANFTVVDITGADRSFIASWDA